MRLNATFTESQDTFKSEFKNLQFIKNENRPVIVDGVTVYDGDNSSPISLISGKNIKITVDENGNIIISSIADTIEGAEYIGSESILITENEFGQRVISVAPSNAINAEQIENVYVSSLINKEGDTVVFNGGNANG